MPQLMSAHSPAIAEQMPNPTDYFASAPKPSCQQQTHPANQPMPLSHSPALQFSFDNQQFNQKYKVVEPTMKLQQHPGYSDVPSFMPDFQPSQQHHLQVNIPPQTNQTGKRPRHSSLSAAVQHSSLHSASVQPAALTRQHSVQGFARPHDMSSLASLPQTSGLSLPNGPPAVQSPVSPAEIHIPSPKNVNYIPNSADVIISTPQVRCRKIYGSLKLYCCQLDASFHFHSLQAHIEVLQSLCKEVLLHVFDSANQNRSCVTFLKYQCWFSIEAVAKMLFSRK